MALARDSQAARVEAQSARAGALNWAAKKYAIETWDDAEAKLEAGEKCMATSDLAGATTCYRDAATAYRDAIAASKQSEVDRLLRIAQAYQNVGTGQLATSALLRVLLLDPKNDVAIRMLPDVQKRYYFKNSIGMALAPLMPGKFLMGSAAGEKMALPDETQHLVHVNHSFWIQATEVTQAQFQSVMGYNPSIVKTDPLLPVENVTWDQAIEFCQRLSQKEQRSYRLPTEAEWEYACRAGTSGPFYLNVPLDTLAWYEGQQPAGGTHPVAQKRPNDFGLYDMLGNVWEWCSDRYAPYPDTEVQDPTGPAPGGMMFVMRVLRGGGWQAKADSIRCAARGKSVPNRAYNDVGFRVVVTGS